MLKRHSPLDNYRKQLTGLVERVSVLITDMPDVLKGLQQELVERWDKWDIERRDRIQADYRELDYKEFSRKYTHADVMYKSKSDKQIHEDNVQSAENLIIDLNMSPRTEHLGRSE